jgi:hypothetical protein
VGTRHGLVESHRLETIRRFAAARTEADSALAHGIEESWSKRSAGGQASLRRLKGSLESEAGRFAAEEIALALNISPTSAHKQLSLARDLHLVHRDLREALERGEITGFVASMIAQTTRKLPDDARRVIDEAVTHDAVEQPAGRAIAAAKARVGEADEYSEAAAVRAVEDRHVYLRPLDDGLALFGDVLPADDAMRAYTRCDDAARAARHAGSPHNLDKLRCDAFVEAMLRCEPAKESDDGEPSTYAFTPARPVTVSVVISLTSLLGLDSKSAWLDGYGTITQPAPPSAPWPPVM